MIDINQEATQDCPNVEFNEASNTLKVTGNSYPENCGVVYKPLTDFIENYTSPNNQLTLDFYFNLINSTSTAYLSQLILKSAELIEKGISIKVKWSYDKFDEEMYDLGQKFESISKLPFEYEAIEDED